jgi:hypothetical protein
MPEIPACRARKYASAQRHRGMHGSFSPRDVQNTLIARGPHFKTAFVDSLRTGNVDLAPTIAALLAFPFDAPDGRVLKESFTGDISDYRVAAANQNSEPVQLRPTCYADDPGCVRPGPKSTYGVTLRTKILTLASTNQRSTYLDRAVVTR